METSVHLCHSFIAKNHPKDDQMIRTAHEMRGHKITNARIKSSVHS